MIFYNLKIAVRSLLRHTGISLINILGLAIGATCSILLFLMVHFSYTTDTFHQNYENIFLFQQRIALESGKFTADKTGGATGPALKETYPQIRDFTRLGHLDEMLLSHYPDGKEAGTNPISFIEKGGAAVDSTFFDVFSFDFMFGGPDQRFQQKDFIYLTEDISHKLFGMDDPTGTTVYFQEGMALTVAGVLRTLPENSTVQFSYLVPFEVQGLFGRPLDSFGGTLYYTYFLLEDPESAEIINADIDEYLGSKIEETIIEERYLTHIGEAYLYGESNAFMGIIIFGIVGIGILLVAAFNYINLTTAKSLERAKEVGIRKTGGATRWQLIRQFLSESVIITLVSVCASILMAELILPFLNTSFDTKLQIPYSDVSFWFFAIGLVLSVGILAGAYPAFMLSSFKPSTIFNKLQGHKSKGAGIRKFLVVSQFSITLFFIVSTIFLFKQVAYVDTADLGIEKENIIYIPTRGNLWNDYEALKTELLNETFVTNVATASELPNNVSHGEIDWGKEIEEQNTIARILWSGDDLLQTFGLVLVNGRFYNKDIQSDIEHGIVVNEEIISMLGYEGDPVGQRFRLWDHDKNIIGVVKNFTFFPIDIGAKAMIIPYRDINQFLFVKTAGPISPSSLARLEGIIKQHNPNYPFEYNLLEDYKNPSLASSERLIPILFYFATLGIFISCLGIFGLALFTVEKRTKEIGIRKVFGASIGRITLLLSQGFVKLVVIANVIALPLAYLALKSMLKLFAVKIALSPVIFLATGLTIIVLAWLTVLWQSITVARKNPASSLRYE